MANGPRIVATSESDLEVGTTYVGESSEISHEPINILLSCGNMGGFRARGSVQKNRVDLVALVTTFADPEWPDRFDENTGRFTYFGDNKKPGRDLHDTSRGGNQLLRWAFAAIHIQDQQRRLVPPFFVFVKEGEKRASTFLGVAAPGAQDCPESEDLVSSWTTRGTDRFQNYRAVFTILDIPVARRGWIRELEQGEHVGANAPATWIEWVESGVYRSATRAG